MKKRIFSFLLALAIVASMVVLPVDAAANITPLTDGCPCGCGKSLSQVDWQPWNVNQDGSPASGHYYLESDYQQKSQMNIGTGCRIVLDLRGHKLTQEAVGKLFLLYGYLAMLDTVGGGVLSASPKEDAVAGAVMVHYNDTSVGVFELYSGTIVAQDTGIASVNGGLVYVGANSTFRMFGGTLLNGRTKGSGGAIYGSSGTTVEIFGGRILGCRADTNGGSIYSSSTLKIENCTVWGGSAGNFGGNFYQTGGSLYIKNCDIAYGSSESTVTTNKYGGGNICSVGSANVQVENTTIQDGYASLNGGNIYYTTGSYTFKNTEIRGGVCKVYGNNIAAFSNNITTLENCTLSGDFRYGAGTLTLKGATKIGLTNNGLDLYGGSATTVIQAAALTEGAEIFVEANGVFAEPGANPSYFKPAIRTGDITVNADGQLTALQVSSGEPGGYCPHCNQRVTWTRFGTESNKVAFDSNHNLYSGHYYLDANDGYVYNLNEGKDFVLDLNSHTLTVSNRMFKVYGESSLSILDSTGSGKLTAKGVNNSSVDGGLIYNEGHDFTLNVYGGQLIYAKTENRIIKSGSIVYSKGGNSQINIHGGIIDGSQQSNTDEGVNGGAIYLDGTDTTVRSFTMTAGQILGGHVNNGGAVYLGSYVDTTIRGGVITGGKTSATGGNLYFKGTGSSVDIKNCAIYNGEATANGGNLYTESISGKMENCYLAGGQADVSGGNLRLGLSVTLTISDTILTDGTSNRGGNLYTAATNSVLTLENCSLLSGVSTEHGGNIFFNNGQNIIQGGEYLFGVAAAHGGNIHTNAGNQATAGQFTRIEVDAEGNAPLICAGTAAKYGGNLHTVGITELLAAHIATGKAENGKDIYSSKGAVSTKFTVGEGVSGDISMGVTASQLAASVYGSPIGDTVSQGIRANIFLEGNYGNPVVVAKDGMLYVGGTSVVDQQGKEIWYTDNAAAVAACKEEEYVKLYTDSALVLTKDCFVDLNGHTVQVSGDYTLFGMDNSGDGFAVSAGKAIGAKNGDPLIYAPNGNAYYALTEGNETSYHRMEMRLTDIALRPSSSGIYYKAAWGCDDVLDKFVEQYGIVVSIQDMPCTDFSQGSEAEENRWVTFEGTIADSEKKCGVLVDQILKTANSLSDNKENAQTNIYATAFIVIDGVTYLTDDPGIRWDDVNYSLYSFMETADRMIDNDPHSYNQQERALQGFYEAWLDNVMADWSFLRLNQPEATGELCNGKTLKLLAITSSFGLNTTQHLYDIAKAEGCENVVVGRLYASGCTLRAHDSNAKNNTAAYNYTKNESGTWVARPDTTMEYGLLDEDWDIIFIQQSAAESPLVSTYGTYIDGIMEYVQNTKTNPSARFVWNMTWAYQSDSTQSVFVNTFHSDQMAMYESILDAVNQKVVGRADFSAIIPTGTAIQNARTSYFGDTLTKDTYHLNTLGRAIAGYTVWSILTGKPLTEINLGPVNSSDLPELLYLTDADRLVIIDAVNNAIEKPFEVTVSAYPTK